MKDKKKLLKITGTIVFLIAYTVLLVILIPLLNWQPIVPIDDEKTPTSAGYIEITKMSTDITVIPDKYNTGVSPSVTLTKVSGDGLFGGVTYKLGSGGQLGLDLLYSNTNLGSKIVIENMDFSAYPFIFLNDTALTTNKEVIFRNCNFSSVKASRTGSKVKYTFENCTLLSFNGSDCTFDKCKFGGSSSDALNPFKNVTVTNSYISDLAHYVADGSTHTDGTQIFGFKDVDAENIHFYNCRYEVPPIKSLETASYVNACFMVSVEASNGKNISFKNMIINGGGYSIYTTANSPFTLSNILIENVSVGASARWGTFYNKNTTSGVTINNVNNTNSLYVASVWKTSDSNINLSVTNDTNQERTLLVVTKEGEYKFSIPATPTYDQMSSSYTFKDFPFDMLMTVPASDWVVCYDITDNLNKQIRYETWTSETALVAASTLGIKTDVANETVGSSTPVLDSDALSPAPPTSEVVTSPAPVVDPNAVVLTGAAGKSITYTLYQSGKLVLSGSGATTNYNSRSLSPWTEYADSINEIILEGDITTIGTQIFRGLKNVTSVNLPESVVSVGSNAFISCTSLTDLKIARATIVIGDYAFHGTALKNVVYSGTQTLWNQVSIGKFNAPLLNAAIQVVNEIIATGTAGASITWSLTDLGVLELSGTGATYNYNSTKASPWTAYADKITTIKVGEGITSLGSQLFRNNKILTSVTLPSTLTMIGSNAFINCSSLTTITIPASVIQINDYAFHATGLTTVSYLGTSDQWKTIKFGRYNVPLTSSTLTFVQQ